MLKRHRGTTWACATWTCVHSTGEAISGGRPPGHRGLVLSERAVCGRLSSRRAPLGAQLALGEGQVGGGCGHDRLDGVVLERAHVEVVVLELGEEADRPEDGGQLGGVEGRAAHRVDDRRSDARHDGDDQVGVPHITRKELGELRLADVGVLGGDGARRGDGGRDLHAALKVAGVERSERHAATELHEAGRGLDGRDRECDSGQDGEHF
mmetsp:Transcript_1981/g.6539  ORF Transcript_1981/g.6539 Transcript_1981/m.6539 type:complete len:209 (-) Transcript_1981:51-677(-)